MYGILGKVMLLRSDPPVFIEESNETQNTLDAAKKFKAEIYENLLKIEFNINHISTLGGEDGVVLIRDELVNKLRSNNNDLKQEILDSVKNNDYVLDLNYSDLENPDLDDIEGYTDPKPTRELLKIAGIYNEVILTLAQKLVDLEDKIESEANETIVVNPTLILELYKLPSSEQRNSLIDRLMFGVCNYADLTSLEEFQRQFILGPSGIYTLYNKKCDLPWIKAQSKDVLEFLGNTDVMAAIDRKNIPLQNAVSIFKKFGQGNAFAIIIYGIDSKEELLAFASLSPQELSLTVKIAKSIELDSLNLDKIGIINIIKRNPQYFRKFVGNEVEKYVAEFGEEYSKILGQADETKRLYFTSPATIRLIDAIGVRHTNLLYTNHFETFSALYSQGEWFLHNYRSNILSLINMHLDDRLFPKGHVDASPSQRMAFHREIKLLRQNLTNPEPPPRTNSLSTESYAAELSSSSSSFER